MNSNDSILLAGDLNIDALNSDVPILLNHEILGYFDHDLNINLGGVYNEYKGMHYLLSGDIFYIRDLKYHSHAKHLPTFGEIELVNGIRQPKEKVLTLLNE